jgi:hypothetical protein
MTISGKSIRRHTDTFSLLAVIAARPLARQIGDVALDELFVNLYHQLVTRFHLDCSTSHAVRIARWEASADPLNPVEAIQAGEIDQADGGGITAVLVSVFLVPPEEFLTHHNGGLEASPVVGKGRERGVEGGNPDGADAQQASKESEAFRSLLEDGEPETCQR